MMLYLDIVTDFLFLNSSDNVCKHLRNVRKHLAIPKRYNIIRLVEKKLCKIKQKGEENLRFLEENGEENLAKKSVFS